MSNIEKQKMMVVEVGGKKVGIPLWQFEKINSETKFELWKDATLSGNSTEENPLRVTNPVPPAGVSGYVLTKTDGGQEWLPFSNSNVYVTKILDISADGKTGTVQCLDGFGEATGEIFDDVTLLGAITSVGGVSIVQMGETAWSLTSTPADNNWRSVCYGNGKFVAVASNGSNRVMYSTDEGRTWTLCNTPSATSGAAWQSVCFGNGVFVAVANSGTNRVMVSTDGINWTAYKAAAQNSWQSVCFGNDRFVAVASSGSKRAMYSTNNGQTWSLPAANSIANSWRSVCFGNGKFVAVASSGTTQVMVSGDGATWIGYVPPHSRAYRSVCFGEGKFVAVSSGAKSYHSIVSEDDGATWTSYTMPNRNWQCVCYGDGLWVAVTNSGNQTRAVIADDGHSWGRSLTPKDLDWQSVCYGDGIFVGVAASGKGDRAMSSTPTQSAFNINGGFVGQYALVVEVEGTKFAILPGGSLTGDLVEDEEQIEESGTSDNDFEALIEIHNNDSDAHAELFASLQEQIEEHFDDEEAHLQLFEAKQNKITATGQTNLLTAPSVAGGQPDTKPISDFATAAQGTKADTAYQKPSTGIPKTDLASAVQTSLGKADTALQSFTETDPTVPAWAKAASKPTYTASEVGAAPANVALAATSNTDTTTTTTAVSSATVATVMQTIWNKIRSVVNALALKANDTDVVKLSGNQTIAGTKTFSSTISGSVNGNAATATKLATARTIGGISFDGTANINLPGVNTAGSQNTTGTASNATNLTGNVSVTLGTTESTTKFGTAAISQTLTTWFTQIGQRINGIIQALSGKANTNHNQAASTITAGVFATSAGTYTFDGSSVVRLGTTSAHRAYIGFGDGDYIRIGEYESDDKLSFKASTYQFYAGSTAIASATTTGFAFAGTPTAPTAAAGTNTTQIATTAFVTTTLGGKANDADVVKLSGNQTIAGTKTFSSTIAGSVNGNAANLTAFTNTMTSTAIAASGASRTGSAHINQIFGNLTWLNANKQDKPWIGTQAQYNTATGIANDTIIMIRDA